MTKIIVDKINGIRKVSDADFADDTITLQRIDDDDDIAAIGNDSFEDPIRVEVTDEVLAKLDAMYGVR